MSTTPVPAHLRVLRRCTVQPDGCLTYDGHLSRQGYGKVTVGRRSKPTHRVVYEALVHPVPDDLVMDHLCRNRACVNPHHLEPVTTQENILRGVNRAAMNRRKTHCERGHDLSGPDSYVNPKGERICKVCRNIRKRQDVSAPCDGCGEYGTITAPTRTYDRTGQLVRFHPACVDRLETAESPLPRCRNGHEFTELNTRWEPARGGVRRRCRACIRDYSTLRRAKK